MQSEYEKRMTRVAAALEKWRGANAKLWTYSASHKLLVVRLEVSGRIGNLHISCGDLISIRAPAEWRNCSLEFEHLASKEFLLSDSPEDVQILAGYLDVADNCSPTRT